MLNNIEGGDKMSKISKVKAKYEAIAKIRLCRTCRYFVKGRPNECYKVVGKIDFGGFCMYWHG